MDQLTYVLADFSTRTRFEDLPDDLVHEMKRIVLDSIGCAIGGLSTQRGQIACRLARRLGGCEESTILGTPHRVSCENAAFANGELIMALDFDALCGGGHITPYVLPTALALGEREESSGKDLITALAVGHEVIVRIEMGQKALFQGVASGPNKGQIRWALVYGFGGAAFGAAVSSGNILHFDREKMATAIGIVGYNGPHDTFRKWLDTAPNSMMKYGSGGWGAKVGMNAALLALEGYVGDTDLFDGETGFGAFSGGEEWWPDRITTDLGDKWLACETFYKQYPCGH